MGGITANDSLTPEIIINNQGKVSVILEKAILKTGEGEYFAHPFDEKGWEAVSPGSNRRFALQYDFRKSVGNILKEPVEIILILKIGENSTKLSIPMIKSESEKP